MGADIVEVVAGNELSGQRLVGIAQSGSGLLAHGRLGETVLVAQPSCRPAIADADIVLQVEALLIGIVDDCRRR